MIDRAATQSVQRAANVGKAENFGKVGFGIIVGAECVNSGKNPGKERVARAGGVDRLYFNRRDANGFPFIPPLAPPRLTHTSEPSDET